ncbi:MAG TPA: UDP-N-acetylglucosamine pyrophosphorylase [Kiritimatiellia bacterium]|nr:UDP-N-acetylglucosamine pyrophosphorylase [Kiritimatiellia bacterium]HMO97814.1 UDP-N-acetylglucosamine pyrophosphorylase [Kiritimatiellia bacterium]HMP96439.1 UDP-N-acetylglucosamine pyrophosphorylase [Kiritimatiellia bacterium]
MSALLVEQLIKKGVVIPQPNTVWISPDIDPGHIAPGAVLHAGCRIEGARTVIDAGAIIGREGPAVVMNCQVGREVHLASGYFEGSVFLDGSSMGGAAHVRPGCLIEEQAGGAHAVGLKQTVLLPYVTLGSLVNFCDCLMAGGTNRKNHSEVGSSYIHFNFTPHQDKATGSLIGDAPRGIWLDQPPIFLGGQGGLVGPARIAFGTVIPAGQIIRRDITEAGQLVVAEPPAPGAQAYDGKAYGRIDRLVRNNLNYIGNLRALRAWYTVVRKPFMVENAVRQALHAGALKALDALIEERVKRLGEVVAKLPESLARLRVRTDSRGTEAMRQQQVLIDQWPSILQGLTQDGDELPCPDALLARLPTASVLVGTDYLHWVSATPPEIKAEGTTWLDAVVARTVSLWKL